MTTTFPLHHYDIPHLDAFIEDRRLRGLRDSSIYQRCLAIRRLARHIAPTDPHKASAAQLRNWMLRTRQDGQQLAQGSRAVEAACLRAFYGFLVRTGRRDDNPTDEIPITQHPRRFPRPISEADLEIAIHMADPRMSAWLRLAGWAGLRAGEIAALRQDDILIANGLIFIREGKGGRPGVVPAHKLVIDALYEWGLNTTGWLFPHYHEANKHIAPWSVSAKTARYLRSIGIDATIHQLRHRFGTEIYKRSQHDLRTTQELLRHATPVSTAIYTQLDPTNARAAVDAL